MYRFESKVVGRSAGRNAVSTAAHNTGKQIQTRSAVRAVAYRMRESLTDEKTGQTWDYSNKFGGAGSELHVPAGAPGWMQDRSKLWNGLEQAEKRKDAQLAHDFVITLPYSLTVDQRREALRTFVTEHFLTKGKAVDIGYHDYGEPVPASSPVVDKYLKAWRGQGIPLIELKDIPHDYHEPHVAVLRKRDGGIKEYALYQPHAHVMVPIRGVDANGFCRIKEQPPKGMHPNKWFSERLTGLRKAWAATLNRAFEAHGIDERVDHRSLAEQGIDKEPQTKKGPVASKMEREGRASHAGNDLREIEGRNAERVALKAQIIDLQLERLKRMDPNDPEATDSLVREQKRLYEQAEKVDPTLAAEIKWREEHAKREREAEEARRREATLKAEMQRKARAGEIADPQARYAVSLVGYNATDPYASLIAAAVAEAAIFKEQQMEWRKKEAEEHAKEKPDQHKLDVLRLSREIEFYEYNAAGNERMEPIARLIEGVGADRRAAIDNRMTTAMVYHVSHLQCQEEARTRREELTQKQQDHDKEARESFSKEVNKYAATAGNGELDDAAQRRAGKAAKSNMAHKSDIRRETDERVVTNAAMKGGGNSR